VAAGAGALGRGEAEPGTWTVLIKKMITFCYISNIMPALGPLGFSKFKKKKEMAILTTNS
jgi:hypothetical protein